MCSLSLIYTVCTFRYSGRKHYLEIVTLGFGFPTIDVRAFCAHTVYSIRRDNVIQSHKLKRFSHAHSESNSTTFNWDT